MMKNKNITNKLQITSFRKMLEKIKYIAYENEIEIIEASKYYLSSKKCSECGEIKRELKLKDRIYKCEKCGLEIDRDLNAAINLSRY